MCTVLCPLCGIRQKWQRKLQLGCRRTGNDARLRGDDDAVRAVHLLRCRLGFRSRCRAPDLYQMNTGEDGVVKSIVSLVGACLFIIGASIVFPAFFGYRI